MGVKYTFSHHLKAIEKKLCCSGGIKIDEYYDFDLPKLHMDIKKLRELSLPKDE